MVGEGKNLPPSGGFNSPPGLPLGRRTAARASTCRARPARHRAGTIGYCNGPQAFAGQPPHLAVLRWLDRTPPNVGEAHDSLKHIANDAHRADSIIQSVRAIFSSVGHGGDAQPRTPVDTNELIRKSVAILRGELEAAKIIAQLELAKEPPLISADSGQLKQVLLNLIANAADAMRGIMDRARVLKLTSRAIQLNAVAVSIEDTGTGKTQETSTASSKRSLPRSPMAWGWGSQFASPSLNPTVVQ